MKRRFLSICCLLLLLLTAAASAERADAPVDLLAVDHKLYELGYRDSACTGEMSAAVIRALKNFQIVNQLPITGEPDEATVALLLGGEGKGQADYLRGLQGEYAAMPTLSNGSYGEGVTELQKALRSCGYFSGECDGAYGRATEEAVYRFQLANGLQPTGSADSALFLRIYGGAPVAWEDFLRQSCASVGESGAHVRRIQLALKYKNCFSGACTGRYGDGTQQAVRRFQLANDLQSSGDVDLQTCRLLFSDVSALRTEAKALRRGARGNEVSELRQALLSLGYDSGESFNLRTELGVMQFQLVNEISVTGVADATTLARIGHPSVRGMDAFDPANFALEIGESCLSLAAKQAAAALGQEGGFEDDFDFACYVYLKCGQPLVRREQLQVERIESRDGVRAGQILFLSADGEEICGVATADGGLIYAGDSGYVVLKYLDSMNVEDMFGCIPEAAA